MGCWLLDIENRLKIYKDQSECELNTINGQNGEKIDSIFDKERKNCYQWVLISSFTNAHTQEW
jgi:hypothetical protein